MFVRGFGGRKKFAQQFVVLRFAYVHVPASLEAMFAFAVASGGKFPAVDAKSRQFVDRRDKTFDALSLVVLVAKGKINRAKFVFDAAHKSSSPFVKVSGRA